MKSKTLIVYLVFTLAHTISMGQSSFQTEKELHGILQKHIYRTTTSGAKYKKMLVYLPHSYYSSCNSYPVIYFLHGANGNETSWVENGNILSTVDSLTLANLLGECICIFPNMNNYWSEYEALKSTKQGSIEAFFSLDGSSEYSFINDIMKYVDEHFRTIDNKNYRAICGLSIGGMQSLYISAQNPEIFGYIGLFSPLIYPPATLGEHKDIYRHIETKLYSQFLQSPNRYWIMMGHKDIYLPSAYKYSIYLQEQKYQHRLILTSGGHTWKNWIAYSIQFLNGLWVR